MCRRQRLFGVKNQIKGLMDKTGAEKMEVGSVNHTFENIGSGCVERNESMKRGSHILFFVHFFKIVVRRAIIYHE